MAPRCDLAAWLRTRAAASTYRPGRETSSGTLTGGAACTPADRDGSSAGWRGSCVGRPARATLWRGRFHARLLGATRPTQRPWANLLSSHNDTAETQALRGVSLEQDGTHTNRFYLIAGDGTRWMGTSLHHSTSGRRLATFRGRAPRETHHTLR